MVRAKSAKSAKEGEAPNVESLRSKVREAEMGEMDFNTEETEGRRRGEEGRRRAGKREEEK